MNLQDAIEKLPKDIITSFDVDFDIPFEHDVCIGLLLIKGAFKDNSPLEDRVGAYWCQMVIHDVNYRLLEALEFIGKSKPYAEELTKIVDKIANDSIANSTEEYKYQAYVAARWHDAAGKIYAHSGDYTEARLKYNKAKQIAQHADLWYCLPDVESNLLRAIYDEGRIVVGAVPIDFASEYEKLKLGTIKIAESKNIIIPKPNNSSSLLQNATIENREFLRGLSSILHNESIYREKDGLLELSLQLSYQSEAICRELSDQYRLAQSLNHQARFALEAVKLDRYKAAFQYQNQITRDPYEIACNLVEQVKDMPWKRGKQIAEQHDAKIHVHKANFSKALETIRELLDELKQERQARGGDFGLDNDLHSFTVEAFEDIINKADEANVKNSELDLNKSKQRLKDERLTQIRSTRKVVKVSRYKRDFSSKFSPSYFKLIEEELNSEKNENEKNEEAFSLVEEASCRELLDLLKTRNSPNEIWFKERPSILKLPSTGEGRGARKVGEINEENREILNEIVKRYEEIWFDQPIPTSVENPEISHEVCMFTANEPVVIIRYFFYGYEGKNKEPKKLGAFVFSQGKMHCHKDLNWTGIQDFIKNYWNKFQNSESSLSLNEVSKQLSELFIRPIWDLISKDIKDFINRDQEPEDNSYLYHPRLVLIPSGKIFSLPLHIAFVPDTEVSLASVLPLSFSISTTAYVSRGRHFLQRYPVEPNDDLCVLIKRDKQASGSELNNISWSPEHFHIAGIPPEGVMENQYKKAGKCDREGLLNLIDKKPEFFIYSGHGFYQKTTDSGVETFLQLGEEDSNGEKETIDYLTQYDIAAGIRLPRNKLTLLAACVTGQGSDADGGEVSGFIRSFIAAGCGALGLTLWNVDDRHIANCINHLLIEITKRKDVDKPFDVVYELYLYYRKLRKASTNDGKQYSLEGSPRGPNVKKINDTGSCPLIMYL